MKTPFYILLKCTPRHDRQILTLAVTSSTLLVFIAVALELIGS